ncbi:MAG TPA: hypothetical protein VFG30_19780 [Polyangiales bacterium]|nr:hypothetical protein [Polyangiales bacterium]
MRPNLPGFLLALLVVLSLGACSDSFRRGAAGDSCTSTNDCESGLSCVSQACIAADSGMGEQPENAVCDARRNCETGLACITGTCQIASSGMGGSSRYSGKGESCTAKNDCEPSLACVMGVCRSLTVSLGRVPKSCYRVECEVKEDCCLAFVPNPNCATYEMNCAMDPIFCNTYRSLCQCTQDCDDEQCVAAAPGCMTNAECTSTQTPYCVAGKCTQCDKDSACSGTDAKCSQGVCMAACKQDENCPLLHACQDGVCVETGCKSDRECAFMIRNALAVCNTGECELPCNTDTDCATTTVPSTPGMMSMSSAANATRGFEACEMGKCVFVGCENNSECRALLGLENQRNNIAAVCR